MNTLPIAKGLTLVDVHYLGVDRYIAPCLIEDAEGVAIIDPGPTSSLVGLEDGLAECGYSTANIHSLILTHIHLDHAGATGTLVKRHPHIKVYVHERGSRHLIDPTKLLASAQRLYGEHMEMLWGDFSLTPAENVIALKGGETLSIGGRKLEVVYTPGHAVHHVSYFDQAEGIAFTGDTTGMRPFADNPVIAESCAGKPGCVVPVTPPPDIDLEAWKASLAAIRDRKPSRLFITHFGAFENPEWHIENLEERLARWGERVESDLASARDETDAVDSFAREMTGELIAHLPAEAFGPFIRKEAMASSWHGLARYWTKKQSPQ